MPLYRLLTFGLGHLRAKLAERKTARAAKKAGNARKRRDSAGPKNVMSPPSPLAAQVSEQKKMELLEQSPPSLSPRTTVRMSTPTGGAKPIFATVSASQMVTFVIAPTSTEAAAHLGLLENSPAGSENSKIGMISLEQPWFSRRRSSLMRLSASNMQMRDEVRSPRLPASRRHEYTPRVLDDIPVTSDGIEMEMDEFAPKWKRDLQASSEDSDDADDNASILTIEQVSFLMVHRADPFTFAPSTASVSRDLPIPITNTRMSTNSATDSNNANPKRETLTPNISSCPKLRPAPLPISNTSTKSKAEFEPGSDSESACLTKPLPVQDHFCVISDSPLLFWSFDVVESWPNTPDSRRTTIVFWPRSARSSVSINVSVGVGTGMSQGRSRPGTAGSGGSEYRSFWW